MFATEKLRRVAWAMLRDAAIKFANFPKLRRGPSLRIRHRVPKHIEKEGLGEAALQGQGGAALGAEGFGLDEDGGAAALLSQRGEREK